MREIDRTWEHRAAFDLASSLGAGLDYVTPLWGAMIRRIWPARGGLEQKQSQCTGRKGEMSKESGPLQDTVSAISTFSSPSDCGSLTSGRQLSARTTTINHRIDTNQGVYGIGEVRDAGHRENALRFLCAIGKNPATST